MVMSRLPEWPASEDTTHVPVPNDLRDGSLGRTNRIGWNIYSGKDSPNLVITHISSRLKGVVWKGLQREQGERGDGLPHGVEPP